MNLDCSLETPSPLMGEGWGEGEGIGVVISPFHPLPNPSPIKGEGLTGNLG